MKKDKIIDRQIDIAVVVPVYNPGKRKLKTYIRSILQQSHKNCI